MTAAEILRERARLADAVQSPLPYAAEWRAVADLMGRCRQPVWQVSRQGNEEMVGGTRFLGHRCLMCMSFGPEGVPIKHTADCPLAALAWLIEEERDGD